MASNMSASPATPVLGALAEVVGVAVDEGVDAALSLLDVEVESELRVGVVGAWDSAAIGDELWVGCVRAVTIDSTKIITVSTAATNTTRNVLDRLSHQIPTR